METLGQDLRYAFRALLKQPAFTLIAILTLAIGIGANTAIYTVVDATILRPLPLKDPARLMHVSLTAPSRYGSPPNDDLVWSYPKYQTFQTLQHVFEDTAVYVRDEVNLTGAGEAERVEAEMVSASYFPVLGVHALIGRTFLAGEDAIPEKDFVAVLSYGIWQHSFGADPNIAGRVIHLDLKPYTVVGVLPPDFEALSGPADIWVPVHVLTAQELGQAQSHSWSLIARLKPEATVAEAKSQLPAIGAQINTIYKSIRGVGWGAKARTLDEARTDPVLRRSVLVLFGAVGFVLLIACANIANLLLARASSRQREIAVRLAVGARRARLVRQMLTESVLLSTLGAFASLALAWIGVHLLTAINPATASGFGRRLSGLTLMSFHSIRLDNRALVFTFAIAFFTGILFGMAPAIQASRADLSSALKSGGTSMGAAGLQLLSGKSLLVVAEIALSLMLLAGAGLMLKSFQKLISTRIGVDPENVLTLRVNLPDVEAARATAFWSEIEKRTASLPGVESAGLDNCYPLAGRCNATILWFRDRPEATPGTEPTVGVHFVSPGYFKTLRIPLLRGRWFTDADRMGAPKVVVINQAAAQKLWPGEDPIGKPVGIGQGGFGDRAEVIGIVGDVRYERMEVAPGPNVYISHLQSTRTSLILYARSSRGVGDLAAAIREQIHAIDKDLPVFDVMTLNERTRASTAAARFSATLLTVFAMIALVLAAVGIYGIMSYLVTQRTREIGIRVALGAKPGNVLTLVLERGALLTLAGIALGLAGAYISTRSLTSLLYQVKPDDPATYAVIAALLGMVALAASWIPARRATKVDPMIALRSE